ncbi:hypothetical protein Ancab_003054 [Ancistrocladus abbreviatus]
MNLLRLFVVALMPVLQVLIITGVGLFLASDRINLLGSSVRHSLNNLVFYLFNPSLVAVYLASTITFEDFIKMWFMLINVLLTYIIGSALGWILLKMTKAPKHLHGLVIACCAAGNVGYLLLIIIPAICDESNNPFGDSSLCLTRGKAYVSTTMAISSLYIWLFVYPVVRIYSMRNSSGEISADHVEVVRHSDQNPETRSESTVEASLHSNEHVPVSVLGRVKHHLKNLTGSTNLQILIAPSNIGAIIGFIIGAASPLRKLIIGNSAPLRVIYSSALMLGDPTVPSITLIIGANLLQGLKGSGVGPLLIIGIMVVRYIALPLMGIVVVKAARHFGMVGSDSLYQFVLLLHFAVPPAMSVGTMTQMFEAGQSECSVVMLWTYLVAIIFVTFWSTLFMWLVT